MSDQQYQDFLRRKGVFPSQIRLIPEHMIPVKKPGRPGRDVIVQTSKEDYLEAECYSVTSCLFALAIQRATGDKSWCMDGDALRNLRKDIWCEVPDWMRSDARDFDRDLQPGNPGGREEFELVEFTLDTQTGEVSDCNFLEWIDAKEIFRARRKRERERRG